MVITVGSDGDDIGVGMSGGSRRNSIGKSFIVFQKKKNLVISYWNKFIEKDN